MTAAATGPLYALIAPTNMSASSNELVRRSLHAIRTHLGMEVAYISEFVEGRSHFREVDAPGFEDFLKVGDSYSLDDIYCRHIVEGRLPQLIPDTALEPLAMALPITHSVPIGKHLSVPIRLPDGSTHGMFCCLGLRADPSLRERDLQMMRVLADLTAFALVQERTAAIALEQRRRRIASVIELEQYSVVYQPIWKVSTRQLLGFESLARFPGPPARSPDQWFAEAAELNMGKALELAVVRKALSELASFPPDMYLTVNVSPDLILSGALAQSLDPAAAERIVLEVTEHAQIEDYDGLRRALSPLRDRGIRLAVDDAGAGYSSLQHILQLQPDFIKLDTSLTRSIDTDLARRALTNALVGFASSTGCKIIAEGVETASELAALTAIGVAKAQGYHLGRPMSKAAAQGLANEYAATAKEEPMQQAWAVG